MQPDPQRSGATKRAGRRTLLNLAWMATGALIGLILERLLGVPAWLLITAAIAMLAGYVALKRIWHRRPNQRAVQQTSTATVAPDTNHADPVDRA